MENLETLSSITGFILIAGHCTSHNKLTMVSIMASIVNSDFKVSSLYNTSYNKWKVLLPTKLQFKDDKNPTWHRILDAMGCSFPLLRRVYWPAFKECYGCR
jgi:hypothetical protein